VTQDFLLSPHDENIAQETKKNTHTQWIAAAISDYSIRAVLVDMGLMQSFVISFSCSEANDELKFTDSLGGGGEGQQNWVGALITTITLLPTSN